MVCQLTKFHVQRVDMVINPPWNLPFLGAKGLTSPEQTATGKGISNPFMAVMELTHLNDENKTETLGVDVTNLSMCADMMDCWRALKNSMLKDKKRRLKCVADQNT
ncbi:hypothetical protein Tco_0296205 [Tanacetum coccineum]